MRVGFSGAYALDLPALLMAAEALGVDPALLVELFADVELFLLYAWRPQDDGS